MKILLLLSSFFLLAAISACSSGSGGGSGGGSGAGGGSGTGGSSGAGGTSSSCCPTQKPADGASCGSCQETCTYLECDGVGQTVATCSTTGSWLVDVSPCDAVDCGGGPCLPGQICVERMGGALLYDCADNPCAGQALTCGCGDVLCPGQCEGFHGATMTCNTCPEGTCP